jgi:hypothetical protein
MVGVDEADGPWEAWVGVDLMFEERGEFCGLACAVESCFCVWSWAFYRQSASEIVDTAEAFDFDELAGFGQVELMMGEADGVLVEVDAFAGGGFDPSDWFAIVDLDAEGIWVLALDAMDGFDPRGVESELSRELGEVEIEEAKFGGQSRAFADVDEDGVSTAGDPIGRRGIEDDGVEGDECSRLAGEPVVASVDEEADDDEGDWWDGEFED